jgi:hypothetical protein
MGGNLEAYAEDKARREFPHSGLEIPMPSDVKPPKDTVKSIVDFFDPNRQSHIQAYDELVKTGKWPHGFADGLHCPPGWSILLTEKIANAWVHHIACSGGMKAKLHQAKIRLMNLGDHRIEVETAVAVMEETGRLLV